MIGKLSTFVAALLICVLALLSCRADDGFSGGTELSAAEIQAMLDSAQEQTSASASIAHKDNIYYFVAGSGAVYHSIASCPYLKNSQNVQEGTLSQAFSAGKERLCSVCEKKGSGAQPLESAEGERACYYSAGGTVWHYEKSCSALAHSGTLQYGTVKQALLDGKSRPCIRCGE